MVAGNSLDISQTGLVKFDGVATFTGVTVTQHDVLVGATSNGITSVSPSTSGFVLTSNGVSADPSFQAIPGSSISTVTVDLTNSQIKNLHGTPIQMVAAPGSGLIIVPLFVYSKLIYGGTNAFTASAAQTVSVYFGTISGGEIVIAVPNSMLTQTVTRYNFNPVNSNTSTGATTTFTNTAVNLYNASATEIAGNAANNNTISVTMCYLTMATTIV